MNNKCAHTWVEHKEFSFPDSSLGELWQCVSCNKQFAEKSDDMMVSAPESARYRSMMQEYGESKQPAFPFGQMSEETGQPINGFFNPGITTLDYFAAAALTGLCVNAADKYKPHEIADFAYTLAANMIHQRNDTLPQD